MIKSGAALMSEASEDEQKDSLLFQLSRMFSFLSLSEKQAFDTINFCRSYKDETGRPIDVRIQQDAQEFFTILADRIETELKETKYRHLLSDTFGGQVVHQMLCQGGCNKTRGRTQPFPIISLPIKNRTNMKESLEAFVQSETLEGVTCEVCDKKTTTLKRQVLHTLPNTIFFHLKRFELNFETFRHEKSNARFEFPEEFDMEPYTREGMKRIEREKKKNAPDADQGDQKDEEEKVEKYSVHPKEYYEYELKGIVVHTGSAEAGHYYSYIKDRVTGEWNEFNDSLIKTFDVKFLDNDCFGGKKRVKQSANWGAEWEHDQEKIKNAYILVYDRKQYQTPLHEEDVKKEEDTKAKVGTPEAKQSETESKQEQDNKEDDADDTTGADDTKEEAKEEPLPPAANVMALFD